MGDGVVKLSVSGTSVKKIAVFVASCLVLLKSHSGVYDLETYLHHIVICGSTSPRH